MSDLPGPEPTAIDWRGMILGDTGAVTASRPLYTPKRVKPRHRMIVMLHEAGLTNREIARAVDITEARVSVIIGSQRPELLSLRENFASQVADHARDVASRIKLYANEMLDVMVYHAREKEKDPANSRQAARDILHMAGFTPVKKQLMATTEVPFDQMKELMKQQKEANEVVFRESEWYGKRATVDDGQKQAP